jgi:aldehyde dehydrogenase (NAD+)
VPRSCKKRWTKHKEELRPQIVAEVGTPVGLTYAVQQDSCIDDMQWDIDLIDRYEWEYELGSHEFFGMDVEPDGHQGTDRRAGLITPWNFPFMLNASKLAPALAAGCTSC